MAKRKDTRPIWTIDCETDPFKHGRIPVPFLWGLYTGAGFHTFTETEELVNAIREHDVIVYAHNGGRFDFHYLLDYINLAEKVTVINGRLVVANIGRCELRDSWNILPVKLSDFGGKLEIDYSKLEADVRDKHMPEILAYLRMDCVDLWERINAFETTYGRYLTLASAAMSQWEQISGMRKPHSDRDYYTKFANYYHGGRVQCFQRGHINGPIKVYDINSAYPKAMLDEHPYGTDYITLSNPNDFAGSSMVRVSCTSSGALPFRNERGSMVFPDDAEEREYYVTGHELQAALDTGTVSRVRVIEAIDFLHKVSFEKYIMKFFSERLVAQLDNNIALNIFCKLLMTNLYGKYGANPQNYGNFMCVAFDEMEDYRQEDYEFEGMIGNHALMRQALNEWQEHYINVATAASITGQVRAGLWRAICAAKGMVYCDTDSIMCIGANIDIGKELGQWKDEGTATDAWIVGKKMYCLDGDFGKDKKTGAPITVKSATKGVRLEPEQIRQAAMGATVTSRSEAPSFSLHSRMSVPQALRATLTDGERAKFFKTRAVRMTG